METSLKKVRLWNGKWTYQRSDGTFLDAKGFDYVEPFNDEGLALVRRHQNGPWNYLASNGMLLFGAKELEYIEPFDDNGLARIRRRARHGRDGTWNYLRSDGIILLSEWLENAWRFKNGVAVIQIYKYGHWFLINTNGNIVKTISG